jgi:hypothetical protein
MVASRGVSFPLRQQQQEEEGATTLFALLVWPPPPKKWKNGPPLNKEEVLTLIMARMEVEETFNYNWSATSFCHFLGFFKMPPFLAYFWNIYIYSHLLCNLKLIIDISLYTKKKEYINLAW